MKRTIYIFVFSLFCATSYGQDENAMKTFDPAFVHVVYFWLNNPDSQEDCSKFETSLGKFLNDSEYAKTNFIGTPPQATREVVDGSFTYCLVVTFDSAEAQDKYQKEPAHTLFVEEASSLWNKVIVYDAQGLVK